MDERMLKVEEVADKLNVKIESVRRYIKWGIEGKRADVVRLKAYKIGREYRVRPSDLEDFLAQLSRAA